MKSPLVKLGFKLPGKGKDGRNKADFSTSIHSDDMAQASQDMLDMRDCYDSLLSAAAATANSAYEFSESLREMGCCLKEKSSLHDDEGSGNVQLMLGKVQLELRKLVDDYRSRVVLTITNPSESHLNELRNVEDMKKLCDEKRSVYEYMLAQEKEKGRRKSGKQEQFTLEQLQRARDEYDENATLFVFRMKSLKQGQSRSLLTQAARHHASQLKFFERGLKSLEAVDPHVRDFAEKHHIDYYFKGLDDDGKQFDSDGREEGNVTKEEGERSFKYLELDEDEIGFPQPSYSENRGRQQQLNSYSAPIFMERKNEIPEKYKPLQQSSARNSDACVLPTPNDAKARMSLPDPNVNTNSLWYSSPMEQWKHEKESSNGLKLLPSSHVGTQLPPPLSEALPEKKSVRLSHSGPIITKTSSKTALPSPRGDISKKSNALLYSGPISRSKVSPSSSPPPVSSPRISELHELPRPPSNPSSRQGKALPLINHSAPLGNDPSDAKANKVLPKMASPLPTPSQVISRSYSIPSRGQRSEPVYTSKGESLPLTPLAISNLKPTPVLAPHLERCRGVN